MIILLDTIAWRKENLLYVEDKSPNPQFLHDLKRRARQDSGANQESWHVCTKCANFVLKLGREGERVDLDQVRLSIWSKEWKNNAGKLREKRLQIY